MKNPAVYLFLVSLTMAIFSCEREYEYTNNLNGLTFSVDTLMFDTIFSSIGSVTHNFKIYNPYNEDLIINSVELAGGENSEFRININGYPQNKVENLKINALDSLYIFVDVTIQPEDSNSPFVVNDSIIFTMGEKKQDIKLIAYGQDVVLLRKEKLHTTTFTDDKPYLIYDFIIVDSLETLTIEPGARLHFYDDARLIVFGSMQVNGTTDKPVQFLGHRLEEWYQDKPGQWGQIHFMPGSKNNRINHAEIKNSLMGIFVDSIGLGTDPPLIIENTIINHVSEFGIITQNSKMEVSNTVIGDCGYHSVALTLGGTYNFYHCTLANYFNWSYRSTPALFLNNYFTNDEGKEVINPLIEANFYNSIIYGRNFSEFGYDFIESDKFENKGFKFMFKDCLVKTGDRDISNKEEYNNIIANENPNFIDPNKFNYQLDTLSPCKDIAGIEIANEFSHDILGTDRQNDLAPDIGAYERIENE